MGARSAKKIDVRVISATNMDLRGLIAQNKFREDLYFRIGVLHMVIPPLSKRIDDIPVLAAYFLAQIARIEGGAEKKFDGPALAYLRTTAFPGNVRQMRSLVYRLYVLFDKEIITQEDVLKLMDHKDRGCAPGGSAAAFDMVLSPLVAATTMHYNTVKRAFERQYLGAQLEKHGSNITRTAKAIGLLPNALSRKLKELGITVPRGGPHRPSEAADTDR
jgi:two-component system, NtrC family, nitrogen regulation response regulator NtrX